jgi:hypothetical protein
MKITEDTLPSAISDEIENEIETDATATGREIAITVNDFTARTGPEPDPECEPDAMPEPEPDVEPEPEPEPEQRDSEDI